MRSQSYCIPKAIRSSVSPLLVKVTEPIRKAHHICSFRIFLRMEYQSSVLNKLLFIIFSVIGNLKKSRPCFLFSPTHSVDNYPSFKRRRVSSRGRNSHRTSEISYTNVHTAGSTKAIIVKMSEYLLCEGGTLSSPPHLVNGNLYMSPNTSFQYLSIFRPTTKVWGSSPVEHRCQYNYAWTHLFWHISRSKQIGFWHPGNPDMSMLSFISYCRNLNFRKIFWDFTPGPQTVPKMSDTIDFSYFHPWSS